MKIKVVILKETIKNLPQPAFEYFCPVAIFCVVLVFYSVMTEITS